MYGFKNAATNNRMRLDQIELFVQQSAWFLKDRVGNADLTDIVQQGADAELTKLLPVENYCLRDSASNAADAPAVTSGILIPSIQGACQGLDKLQVSSVKVFLAAADRSGGTIESNHQLTNFRRRCDRYIEVVQCACPFAFAQVLDNTSDRADDDAR